jgi:hypothetical protein
MQDADAVHAEYMYVLYRALVKSIDYLLDI